VAVGGGAGVGVALGRETAGLVLVAPPETMARGIAPATPVLLADAAPWPADLPAPVRIEGADAAFLRGLPALGKAVVACLARLHPDAEP
jgi:hypothetical protein